MTDNDKTHKYYKQMNWKPSIGTIYCLSDEYEKINLFYEVAELTLNKNYVEQTKTSHITYECETLHITYKVYDYRNGKNVNIYYVKLEPLIITAKHIKKDLVIYFQRGHGENRLATHTITDAKNPKVYKTAEDSKATTTKLYKLLSQHSYLCKENAFTSNYSVEDFYTLYNILNEEHRLFQEIIEPHKEFYDRLCDGRNEEYDWIEYSKKRFNEMCSYKTILKKLEHPINYREGCYEEYGEEDKEDEVAEVAELDEEINMF